MGSASWPLQKAIFEFLSADASVIAILGGSRVYDHAPRQTTYPYLTFGQSAVRDWSTSTEEGAEHTVTIRAWSQAGGKRETAEILAVVQSVLMAASLTVDGHHLINLRAEFSEVRREPDGETYRGMIRFRVVTEPAV